MSGKVYLVGAGPGAPDLITVRGLQVLAAAQVVFYDSLVSAELLKQAPPDAELIHVGRRAGTARPFDQAEINRLMVERARGGQRVVRLKGGDPFIFGRGGEEAEALRAAAIEFEIVPGVTSAISAPAFAGIPLTHREYGSFITIATGQAEPGTPDDALPWTEMARAASNGGTLVVLMAATRIGPLMSRLIAMGVDGATPAAAIQWASRAAQKSVIATAASLAAEAERAALGPPAVVVVGPCAGLGRELGWCERMPLFGRRIVVTRAADQAEPFARRLRLLGAEVIEFPTIAFASPSSTAALDRAIAEASTFDWIIFTSARGVTAFIERMRLLGRDLRALGGAAIAAIGPATAARLQDHALTVAAMPTEYRAEAIVDALGPDRIGGKRILIPRAEVAREILPEMLLQRGAREVVIAPAYRTVSPSNPDAAKVAEMAAAGALALVTFTSSSTVTNFCAMLGEAARGLAAAVIGTITAATARAAGLAVVIEATDYTVEGLTAAIIEHFARRQTGPPAPR